MTQQPFQTLLCYKQMLLILSVTVDRIYAQDQRSTPLPGGRRGGAFSLFMPRPSPVPAMSWTLWRGYHATATTLKTGLKKCSAQRKWEK